MDQLRLFELADYDINRKLANLRNSIRLGWSPFSVDKLREASIMYGVSCEIVLKTYEQVINEELSDNSESD